MASTAERVSPAAIASAWEGRGAVAVVDLDAYAANLEALRGMIGPDVALMAVVKANAYGHGAVPLARAAVEAGAAMLGVATVDEGAQLRMAGIEAPVLVFGAIGRAERGRAIGHGLNLIVSDARFVKGLAAEVKASLRQEPLPVHLKASLRQEPLPVHLKVDTGMNRFGASAGEALDVAQAVAAAPELQLAGVMTHQASADAPEPDAALHQAALFDQVLASLRDAGIEVPLQHIANSATTLRFPALHRGMVRAGIATFGLDPDPGLPLPPPFRPILTIHARVMRVFEIGPGDAVGYGGTYRPTRRERAGLVPLGYGDGYRRSLSNAGWMAIHGHRAPVIGRVSMDQVVIRLPDGVEVVEGDPVVVVGDDTDATVGAPTSNELAPLAGTIPYELVTGLSPRLPRLYIRGGQVIAVADLFGLRELT